jgi:hypothetical protein
MLIGTIAATRAFPPLNQLLIHAALGIPLGAAAILVLTSQ